MAQAPLDPNTGSTPAALTLPDAIDATALNYQPHLLLPTGDLVTLRPEALQWEEQMGELSVRAQATLKEAQYPQGWLQQLVTLGAKLYITADWGPGPQEVFRGSLFNVAYDDQGTENIEITAYDDLMALQLSEADRMYLYLPGTTAGAIIRDIVSGAGIDIVGADQISSGVRAYGPDASQVPQLVYTQMKIAAMVQDILTRVFYLGGGAWVLRSRAGQTEIVKPAQNTPIYRLDQTVLLGFRDEQDATQIITEVDLIGPGNAPLITDMNVAPPAGPVLAVVTGHLEYGRFVKIIQDPGAYTTADITEIAQQILQQNGQPRRVQKFTAPDLPFLRRGDAISIHAGTLDGLFIVASVQHDADKRQMQITCDTSGNLDASLLQFSVASGEIAVGYVNGFNLPPTPWG